MMKKTLLITYFFLSSLGIMATDVPTLLILTTASETVQIPISSIRKITYDKAGTNMYVSTTQDTQTFAVASITRMTLSNVPNPTALDRFTDASVNQLTKFIQNGVVYIVKDGKVFTMEGEQVQ